MIEIIPNWHPVLVHFTVALLSMAVFLHLAVRLLRPGVLRDQWLITARWMLWFGVLITMLTLASGIYAYNTVAHDEVSHAAMTVHRNWAFATATGFVVIAVYALYLYRRGRDDSPVLMAALIGGALLLGATAWRGGELVYRHGLGVMSLPDVAVHGHTDADMHGDDGRGHVEGEGMPAPEHGSEPVPGDVHRHTDGEEHVH